MLGQFTRRIFLKGAAAGSGLALGWLGVGGMFFAPKRAQAAMKSLGDGEAKTLMGLTRTIFPHARLDDKYYWKVVEGIDADMAASADVAREIKDGLAKLNQAANGDFTALDGAARLRIAEQEADTPYFGTIKGKALVLLYNNKDVWPIFGYQGSSWEYGGYLNRGFNDLNWL